MRDDVNETYQLGATTDGRIGGMASGLVVAFTRQRDDFTANRFRWTVGQQAQLKTVPVQFAGF